MMYQKDIFGVKLMSQCEGFPWEWLPPKSLHTLESQLRSVGNFAEMGFGVNNLGLALTPANL